MSKKRVLIGAGIVVSLAIGLVVAYFALLGVVRVPTGAMLNTIQVDERLAVTRYVGELRRGDIIVFTYPENPSIRYVKRVVGLPGETILVEGTSVLVNGAALPERRVHVVDPGNGQALRELSSTGSGSYSAYYTQPLDGPFVVTEGEYATARPYRIPDDSYFVLGDNRDNSEDSRVYGPIARSLVVGRVFQNLTR